MLQSISIILVNYCGSKDTIECVYSLLNAEFGGKKNIIIVDNNSPHHGYIDIKNYYSIKYKVVYEQENLCVLNINNNNDRIFLIRNQANLGFGAGNNVGLKLIKSKKFDISSDCCILLNNDTEVEASFLIKIDIFLSKYRKNKIAFSVMAYSYYTGDVDSEGFGYINMVTGRSSHKFRYKYSYLVGSCIIMNSISDIPLFDEKYFLYYEDADYSCKLRQNGYILKCDLTNSFKHKVSESTKQNPQIESIKKESMIRFIRKHANRADKFFFLLLRIVGYMLLFKYSTLNKLLYNYAKPL